MPPDGADRPGGLDRRGRTRKRAAIPRGRRREGAVIDGGGESSQRAPAP